MSLVVIDSKDLKALIQEAVREVIGTKSDPEEYLDAKESAELLRIHYKTILDLKDEIGYIQRGRRILFRRRDLEKYMDRNFLTS